MEIKLEFRDITDIDEKLCKSKAKCFDMLADIIGKVDRRRSPLTNWIEYLYELNGEKATGFIFDAIRQDEKASKFMELLKQHGGYSYGS